MKGGEIWIKNGKQAWNYSNVSSIEMYTDVRILDNWIEVILRLMKIFFHRTSHHSWPWSSKFWGVVFRITFRISYENEISDFEPLILIALLLGDENQMRQRKKNQKK